MLTTSPEPMPQCKAALTGRLRLNERNRIVPGT